MADITLLNLNMLYLRYYDNVDRELHLPLGPLYLVRTRGLRSISGTTSSTSTMIRSSCTTAWISSRDVLRSSVSQ